MTLETFSKTRFAANMKATYLGAEYYIVSINFFDSLLGLSVDKDDDDLFWVRCENAELLTPENAA